MSERFRFWVVTLAAIATMVLTASLGRWQMGRAAEKEALQTAIDARIAEPPLDASSLGSSADAEALVHRRVQALGSWLPEHTVFLDNRQMRGRPGFYVVTPLRLHDAKTVVLVQRGWVPRNFEDRSRVPVVESPRGEVSLQGRIALAPSKLYELGEAQSGAIRQNLDLAQFRQETGLPIADLSVIQTGDLADGLLRDWPKVATGVDKHYGYAFQWFGLCALVAILYVWFQIVRRFRRRPQ